MMTKRLYFAIPIVSLAITLSARAHDPEEHMNNTKNPDCAAMQDMDHRKMDMHDPVTQAMIKQCTNDEMDDDHGEAHGTEHSDDNNPNNDIDADSEQATDHNDDTGHQH
jgi:hypothetical protein